MKRKIIMIGECVLDVLFEGNQPQRSFVGGRIANAGASLAQTGLDVAMVSECAADRVGDIIIDFLQKKCVDTHSVDRFADGKTALSAIFSGGSETMSRIVNYGVYPDERFDVVWPRIDQDDIVIFGSLYGVEGSLRERLMDLLTHCVERHAIIIYLPGFQHGLNVRITHVMPAILENLEISDFVITHQNDVNQIFPGESGEEAYHNHIEFYCHNHLHISQDFSTTLYYKGAYQNSPAPAREVRNSLGWQAGIIAGLAFAIISNGFTKTDISALSNAQWQNVLNEAITWAEEGESHDDNCVGADFAKEKKVQLLTDIQ